ncbi:MAG: NifB/NifX family molybdenum-iron cluster-binding protein [Spirochaetales bacterium]|nr:NifB/NifX family molybdenum-iron cluster-binding protein [Spirochaetales bacterium]
MIVLTAFENNLESKLDPRFGRASGFILVDQETNNHSWLENSQNINSAHGAGIQAASNVVQNGGKVLITGAIGPKAFMVLNEAKVEIFTGDTSKSVAENIEDFKANRLTKVSSATTVGLG